MKRAEGRAAPKAKKRAETTKDTAKKKKSTPKAPERRSAEPEPGERVEQILVSAIEADPDQPRRHFDTREIEDSIEVDEHGDPVEGRGIRVPVIVRRVGEGFRLIEGERRWRSARAKGLRFLPAIVRDIPADRVLEEQVVMGISTRALRPLEIADALARLRATGGRRRPSAEDLALRVGLASPRLVHRYLALAGLVPEARAALDEGAIDVSAAFLLAALGADQQPEALRAVRVNPRYAREVIRERFHLRLASAPFDISDETLPGGTCGACVHNTQQQRELWVDEDKESEARCTKASCHKDKIEESWRRRAAMAMEAGVKAVDGEEAKKIFPWGYSHEPKDGSGLVSLSAECPHDYQAADEEKREARTWGQVLGVRPSMLVKLESGEVREVITREEAIEALRAQGLEKEAAAEQEEADAEADAGGDAPSDDRNSHRGSSKEHRAVKAADERATARAADVLFESFGAGVALWRFLVVVLVLEEDEFGDLKKFAAKRGIEAEDEDDMFSRVMEWAKKASAEDARRAMFDRAIELSGSMNLQGYSLTDIMGRAGVDLVQLCNEERAAEGLPLLPHPEERAAPLGKRAGGKR